jgi:hypothetical protein
LYNSAEEHIPLQTRRRIQSYCTNRAKFPLEELQKHIGKWVAFSRDGERIIESCKDFTELERRITLAGGNLQDVVLERIPDEDTILGGSELGS